MKAALIIAGLVASCYVGVEEVEHWHPAAVVAAWLVFAVLAVVVLRWYRGLVNMK